MWAELRDLVREFPALAEAEANTAALAYATDAERTTKRYEGCFRQFVLFARARGVPRFRFFPASPALAALFIQHEAARGLSPSTLRVAAAALAWAHTVSGYPNPCEDPTFHMVLGGAQRGAAGPVRHAVPLSPDDLHAVLQRLHARNSLRSIRLACMMRVAFGAMLRVSELLALRWCDMDVRPNGDVAVRIVRRKNDQAAEGCTRLIPGELDSPVGLTRLMRRYADALRRPAWVEDEVHLWPRLLEVGVDWHQAEDTRRIYAELRAELEAIGLPAQDYTWHSLRAGAATSAADRGVPEPVLMAVGGWRSAQAARGYVHYSDATLLRAVGTASALDDRADLRHAQATRAAMEREVAARNLELDAQERSRRVRRDVVCPRADGVGQDLPLEFWAPPPAPSRPAGSAATAQRARGPMPPTSRGAPRGGDHSVT